MTDTGLYLPNDIKKWRNEIETWYHMVKDVFDPNALKRSLQDTIEQSEHANLIKPYLRTRDADFDQYRLSVLRAVDVILKRWCERS